MASPVFFNQKEGQEPPFSPGLPKAQCHDHEECLPLPLIQISSIKSPRPRLQYFTKLNICWGYNNIHIKREMSGKLLLDEQRFV